MNQLQESLTKAAHSADFLNKEIREAYRSICCLPDSPENRIAASLLLTRLTQVAEIQQELNNFAGIEG